MHTRTHARHPLRHSLYPEEDFFCVYQFLTGIRVTHEYPHGLGRIINHILAALILTLDSCRILIAGFSLSMKGNKTIGTEHYIAPRLFLRIRTLMTDLINFLVSSIIEPPSMRIWRRSIFVEMGMDMSLEAFGGNHLLSDSFPAFRSTEIENNRCLPYHAIIRGCCYDIILITQ